MVHLSALRARPATVRRFDGDGMLHAVRIRGGKASYSNSYVKTSRLQKEVAAGRSLFSKVRLPSVRVLHTPKRPFLENGGALSARLHYNIRYYEMRLLGVRFGHKPE